MAEVMLELREQSDGSYTLEQPSFEMDESWPMMDTLKNVTKERGRLILDDETRMITVYVENLGETRWPYAAMTEVFG